MYRNSPYSLSVSLPVQLGGEWAGFEANLVWAKVNFTPAKLSEADRLLFEASANASWAAAV